MTDRRSELEALTADFVDAFNRMDIDAVMAFFADDAVYEDSSGGRHIDRAAIRAAFTPLLDGSRGRIRFEDDDLFIDVDAQKVMASWHLHMEAGGKPVSMQGLDLLRFRGDKLIEKRAYAKARTPVLVEAEAG